MFLRYIVLVFSFRLAYALPHQPRAAQDKDTFIESLPPKVGWIEAPQVRGTFDLLLTCITTLSLCAWTAYHPNVHAGRSEWRRWGHRILWMLAAVIIPELVLYCAWDQWRKTRALKKSINEIGKRAFDGSGKGREEQCISCQLEDAETEGRVSEDYHLQRLFNENSQDEDSVSNTDPVLPTVANNEKTKTPQSNRPPKPSSLLQTLRSKLHLHSSKVPQSSSPQPIWTTSIAAFAISGGFAIQTPYHHQHTNLTLTPSGLIQLAKLGLLPDESPETIADKSKADYFAKALVCIQAGWFLLQCLARLAKQLPLSLLEIHVLVHVLCAFAMYLLWIDKPYDVGSPVVIRDERVVDLGALWSLHTEENRDPLVASFQSHSEWTCIKLVQPTLAVNQVRASRLQSNMPTSAHRRYWKVVYDYCGLEELSFSKSSRESRNEKSKPTPVQVPWANLQPSKGEDEHLSRASRALGYLHSHGRHLRYLSISSAPLADSSTVPLTFHLDTRYLVPLRSNLLIESHDSEEAAYPPSSKSRLSSSSDADAPLAIRTNAYSLFSAGYGALHLAAWNAHFATTIEAWLWRGSGIVMVVAAGGMVGVVLLWGVDRALTRWRDGLRSPEGQEKGLSIWRVVGFVVGKTSSACLWTGMILLWLVVGLAWGAYPFARVYVLVECFAGLRSVEREVYRTVEWTGFLPHVG